MTQISPSDSLEESASTTGVLRRTVLKASALTVGALGLSMPVAAEIMDHNGEAGIEVDSSQDFGVELLAAHTTFPDTVAAQFRMSYDGGKGSIVSNLPQDASNVVMAKVTWAPEGTSGWHTHPGPVIVAITEGEIELVNKRDCLVRTYRAGEAFFDPGQGNVHIASNPSATDQTVAYATFLGVPDGASPTISVAPVNCR